MKLAEIKKCKVPELRDKLKELGLDPKGLKAELVGRLWSALEAGLPIQSNQTNQDYGTVTGTIEEVTTHSDIAPSSLATGMDVASSIPSAININRIDATSTPISTTSCNYLTVKEYTDSTTQTETYCHMTPLENNFTAILQEACRESEFLVERQTATIPVPSCVPQCTTVEHTEYQKDPQVHDNEIRWADSSRVPVCGAEEEESQSWQRGEDGVGEDRTSNVSEVMGRAFYEFKEEIRYKRAKKNRPQSQSEKNMVEDDNENVRIDPYASDLHFEVGLDGTCGQPQFCERFPLLWSGCRLTHGVGRGKTSFEVRLERKALTPGGAAGQVGGERGPSESHGLRVGWALDNQSLLLGEGDFSYAYDAQGRKVSGGKSEEFGEPFSCGDIIGCYILFSTDGAAEMSFHKNGHSMGMAFRLDPSVLRGRTMFPHVLCQGFSVRFRLDPTGVPWYPGPTGYTPLVALPVGDRVRAPVGPSSRTECEVVMMVGLPGSGKSHWARILMDQHPEKRYKLLGTETLLASMVSGGPRENKLQQASPCLTELIRMAARKPGNYILDQPNVFICARHHKLQLFHGFRRRVVAVVFPPAEEWRRRLALQQTQGGERIPDTALLKLQVSYSLPEQQQESFEELRYVELPQAEARVLLQAYREEAQRLLPPVPKPEKKKARLRKNRAFGPPPFHSSQWKRRYGWNDFRFNQQAWGPQPIYWNADHPEHGYYYHRDLGYSSYQGHC